MPAILYQLKMIPGFATWSVASGARRDKDWSWAVGLTPVIQFWMHSGRHSLPVGLDVESETNGGKAQTLGRFSKA